MTCSGEAIGADAVPRPLCRVSANMTALRQLATIELGAVTIRIQGNANARVRLNNQEKHRVKISDVKGNMAGEVSGWLQLPGSSWYVIKVML